MNRRKKISRVNRHLDEAPVSANKVLHRTADAVDADENGATTNRGKISLTVEEIIARSKVRLEMPIAVRISLAINRPRKLRNRSPQVNGHGGIAAEDGLLITSLKTSHSVRTRIRHKDRVQTGQKKIAVTKSKLLSKITASTNPVANNPSNKVWSELIRNR